MLRPFALTAAALFFMGNLPRAAAQDSVREARRFLEEGERPVPAGGTPGIRLEPAGIEGVGCMFVGRIGPGAICEYGIRMVRTVGRDLSRFCESLTGRVTDLGEGDLEDRANPGIQQCRHVVNRMQEMARRIRDGRMSPAGAFDAATAVHRRISGENRAWLRMKGLARGQCRTEEERQAFDQNFEALQTCVREIWPAINEIAAAEKSRR